MTEKKRVVLYCRVAGPDHDGAAIEMQIVGLRRYAEEQGAEIVDIVEDNCAGTSLARPGFEKLFDLAAQDAMDEVLARSVSRLGRHLTDVVALVERLQAYRITVRTLKEGLPDSLDVIKAACEYDL